MSAELVLASGGIDCHLMSGCGFPAPGAEIFQFDAVFSFTVGSLEFNITKVTILLFIVVVVLLSFFLYAFRKPQLVPRGAQNVGELGYLFIRDGIKAIDSLKLSTATRNKVYYGNAMKMLRLEPELSLETW